MTIITLEVVLEQARRLNPNEQARLIKALWPTVGASTDGAVSTVEDEDLAEQQDTWAYLQQSLDEDRLSSRPLFERTAVLP